LSWRLQHRGWLIYYNPKAKAYHFRQTPAYSQKKKFYFDIPQQFKKSFLVSCLSWRNHLWVILKNCPLKLFISCFFPFVFFQKVKALWLLFYCPKALFFCPCPLSLKDKLLLITNPVLSKISVFSKKCLVSWSANLTL